MPLPISLSQLWSKFQRLFNFEKKKKKHMEKGISCLLCFLVWYTGMLSGPQAVPACRPSQVWLMPSLKLSHQDSPATGTKCTTTCPSWARTSRVPPTHWLTSYRAGGGRRERLHLHCDFIFFFKEIGTWSRLMGLFMKDIKWFDIGINKQSTPLNSKMIDVFYFCNAIKIFQYDESFSLKHFIKDELQLLLL